MRRWIFRALAITLLCPTVWAGESVLYSVTTEAPGGLTKTEIFAVDVAGGKQQLVFSDANAKIRLLPENTPTGSVVAAGRRIFSEGIELRSNARGDLTFAGGGPLAVYELSSDGSNAIRKVREGNLGEMCVSHSGSKLGMIGAAGEKIELRILDSTTGELQRKIVLGTPLSAGVITGSGWLPDDQRIFITVSETDEEADWTNPHSPIGSYIISADGEKVERIAPEASMHLAMLDLETDTEDPATVIGLLPDGRYLLSETKHGAYPSHLNKTVLYTFDPATKDKTPLPLKAENARLFYLSPSGEELVFDVAQTSSSYSTASSHAVYVMELSSRKTTTLFSFSAKEGHLPATKLVGWLDFR